MKKDKHVTTVKFLIEKPEGDLPCSVFAFFPEEDYFDYTSETKCSYAHIGQHSPCVLSYANECKEADYNSYNDLKTELEGLGYNLKVLNSDFKRQDAINKGKIWQVYLAADTNENVLFEGNKTACLKYIKDYYSMRLYKSGYIRLAQVILELEPSS